MSTKQRSREKFSTFSTSSTSSRESGETRVSRNAKNVKNVKKGKSVKNLTKTPEPEKKFHRFFNVSQEKGKRLEKLLFLLGLLLIAANVPILLFNFFLFVSSEIRHEQVPELFGITPTVVLTDSMNIGAQSIQSGDMIFAKKEAKYVKGEVILFREKNLLTVHRIIGEERENNVTLFTTKGDANNTADSEKVREENVVGKYVYRLPHIGHFVLFLKQPKGMLCAMGLPFLTFILYDFVKKRC